MSADRAALYRRLPVTAADRWWIELADGTGGGHVVEVGAGVGRLTVALLSTGAVVTAVERDPDMLAVLRERVGDAVRVVAGDATDLPELPPADLVVLPTSLLNELPDGHARRAALATAAGCVRPGGEVALHVLGPWWLVRLHGEGSGELVPLDGGDPVTVTIAAGELDPWTGRRAATMTYRFPDGTQLHERVDAAVVTPAELEAALSQAGLAVIERWGARPGLDLPTVDAPAFHVRCRAPGSRPGP